MTKFETTKMTLQLNFTYPSFISYDPLEKDQLSVKVLQDDVFVTDDGLHSLPKDYHVAKRWIPKQALAEHTDGLDNASTALHAFFATMVVSQITINLLMGAAIKFCWGLVNTLQFLVFTPYWQLGLPANAHMVLKTLKYIALGEFIPYDWLTNWVKGLFGFELPQT